MSNEQWLPHFIALNRHAGAVTMGTFYALLPVTAAVLHFIFNPKHPVPSWRALLAWAFAIAAVYFISWDTQIRLKEEEAASESAMKQQEQGASAPREHS